MAGSPDRPSAASGVTRYSLTLFNPSPLFRGLDRVFSPVRWLAYLIYPLTVIAAFIVIFKWTGFVESTRQVFGSISVLAHLAISMLTANLIGKIAQGAAMSHYGADSRRFGIRLVRGVLPRFFIARGQIRRLSFPARRSCYGAPLVAKLGMFSIGIVAWAMLARSGSSAAGLMLVFGLVGLGSFLFTLNPLWPADGYNLFASWVERPQLREHALRLMRLMASFRRPPEALGGRDKWVLIAFALLSVVYTIALIVVVLASVAVALETELRGTGVFLFLVLLAMAGLFLLTQASADKTREARRRSRRAARAAGAAGVPARRGAFQAAPAEASPTVRDADIDVGMSESSTVEPETARARRRARLERGAGRDPSGDLDDILEPGRPRRRKPSWWRKAAIFAVVAAVIILAAILPYPFRVGGEFIVQPVERAEVRARTDGEILQVLVEEGDWVEEGDVLAILSDWKEVRDVGVREAEVAKGKAELQTLIEGARPEEVALAQRRVAEAKVEIDYYKKELERQRELLERGVATEKQLDIAESRYLAALAKNEEAVANLNLVKAPTRSSEVEAARASVRRDEHDLELERLQLEHTKIRAVVEGQVVGWQGLTVGAYLPEGGLLTQLEDNRTVEVEIEVPETEIREVEIGASAELKLWSAPAESIFGTVRRIAPAAEERDFGRVVRVLVEVPNPDGVLAANMTGYGKIAASERPVWKAFTRAFVRFYQVELWSWLP